MYKIFSLYTLLFFLMPVITLAHKPTDFLPEKPGK